MHHLSWGSKVSIVLLGGVSLLLILLILQSYQDFLGLKSLVPAVKAKTLHQGDALAVSFKTSKDISGVKIEICRGNGKTLQCKSLADQALKSSTTVRILTNYPLGDATVSVTNRDKQGKITNVVQKQIAVKVIKAVPTPTPEPEQGGGGSGSSGGGNSNEGSSNSNTPATNYELTKICYEGANGSVHISWKPAKTVVRFRKTGETTWLPSLSSCNVHGQCSEVSFFEDSDYRKAIIYTSHGLAPNTDFEFQFVPYYSSPDGSAENSQLYKFNSGPQPDYFDCRSLL